jgi:hypothetical protein
LLRHYRIPVSSRPVWRSRGPDRLAVPRLAARS